MQILVLRDGCLARPGTGGWREREESLGWDEKRSPKLQSRSPRSRSNWSQGRRLLFA